MVSDSDTDSHRRSTILTALIALLFGFAEKLPARSRLFDLGALKARATDARTVRAQGGVVALLITLLIAGIVLMLGPVILGLLESSLPSTENTSFNSTFFDVAGNVDTAFVIGGVLLVIIVIGAMITVLMTSFRGGGGGGRGGMGGLR